MSGHPEDVRLAAAHALEVTVYSRPGCHLCDEAKAVMQPLLKEFGGVLREVNIDKDTELAERYGWDIPGGVYRAAQGGEASSGSEAISAANGRSPYARGREEVKDNQWSPAGSWAPTVLSGTSPGRPFTRS